ncbi:hypothetical protein ASPBRDRAFT_657133 [Aspergillus brasiliensis CBS 101740]|uniref:Uncharacterized protein n=1 Tax=Aspergillus brasiliensis (strain CBS 101740 / IMI 381727 / IBT 21946) TaxID=767769 RepID=A0A1L9UCD2_ASPBC|nr:hypothetical protein ASPBRDRAFT_657133 [Aspergillus brasiliensis CBS 101740]
MPGYQYKGQEVNYELIADIVQLLEENGIPCFLIGDYMFEAMGAPGLRGSIELVFESHDIDKAIRILRKANFPDKQPLYYANLECPRCPRQPTGSAEENHFIPYYSFHLNGHFWGELDAEFHTDLCLYEKHNFFWDLPELTLEELTEDDPHFILASDYRLPPEEDCCHLGRFPDTLYPVKIPMPVRYVEAMMLLTARDWEIKGHGWYWRTEITYMWTYELVDILEEFFEKERFKPIFRAWWTVLEAEDTISGGEVLCVHNLRRELLAAKMMPETPLTWLKTYD